VILAIGQPAAMEVENLSLLYSLGKKPREKCPSVEEVNLGQKVTGPSIV